MSHVIDADLVKFHPEARARAEKYGARFFLIHIFGEEDEILERLRKRGDEQYSMAKEREYFERKAMHKAAGIPEVFYSFNSSGDFEKQFVELVDKIKDSLARK